MSTAEFVDHEILDVSTWLNFFLAAGFGEAAAAANAEIFKSHEVDLDMLPFLTHEILLQMGFSKAGHRIRILRMKDCIINPKNGTLINESTDPKTNASAFLFQNRIFPISSLNSQAHVNAVDPAIYLQQSEGPKMELVSSSPPNSSKPVLIQVAQHGKKRTGIPNGINAFDSTMSTRPSSMEIPPSSPSRSAVGSTNSVKMSSSNASITQTPGTPPLPPVISTLDINRIGSANSSSNALSSTAFISSTSSLPGLDFVDPTQPQSAPYGHEHSSISSSLPSITNASPDTRKPTLVKLSYDAGVPTYIDAEYANSHAGSAHIDPTSMHFVSTEDLTLPAGGAASSSSAVDSGHAALHVTTPGGAAGMSANAMTNQPIIKYFLNDDVAKQRMRLIGEASIRNFSHCVKAQHKINQEFAVFTFDQKENKLRVLKDAEEMDKSLVYYVMENSRIDELYRKLEKQLKKDHSQGSKGSSWNSDNNPLQVDFVPESELYMSEGGRIGMCMCPGRKKKKTSHEWDRDLDKDLARLKEAYKANVLVSLVKKSELTDLKIPNMLEAVEKVGIESIHFPIKDKRAPDSMAGVIRLVDTITQRLRDGKTVVVHCNGGKGRTGTVVVATLVAMGKRVNQSIDVVRKARSGTIKNPLQIRFVMSFKTAFKSYMKRKLAIIESQGHLDVEAISEQVVQAGEIEESSDEESDIDLAHMPEKMRKEHEKQQEKHRKEEEKAHEKARKEEERQRKEEERAQEKARKDQEKAEKELTKEKEKKEKEKHKVKSDDEKSVKKDSMEIEQRSPKENHIETKSNDRLENASEKLNSSKEDMKKPSSPSEGREEKSKSNHKQAALSYEDKPSSSPNVERVQSSASDITSSPKSDKSAPPQESKGKRPKPKITDSPKSDGLSPSDPKEPTSPSIEGKDKKRSSKNLNTDGSSSPTPIEKSKTSAEAPLREESQEVPPKSKP